MSLKDASAYNVQFLNGKPIFIDTLSFEKYKKGTPWVAYKQFCQHFLTPLALAAYVDNRLIQLLRDHLDGIPLNLASKLLPFGTKFNLHLYLHIHRHARYQDKFLNKKDVSSHNKDSNNKISKNAVMGILDSLKTVIKSLKPHRQKLIWSDYYQTNNNYSNAAATDKSKLITEFYQIIGDIKYVWDMGANSGYYSRISSNKGIFTISSDLEYDCIEQSYYQVKDTNEKSLLPLVLDLTNPSPSLGWNLKERMSIMERVKVDVVLALALIHHLVIGNNWPLKNVALFFASFSEWLIIEFVSDTDSQVIKLLQHRKNIFSHYTIDNFEAVFLDYYTIIKKETISGSERTLYLLKKKSNNPDTL